MHAERQVLARNRVNNYTPAEKAGIAIPGPDKLLTLIRCAAASHFNFA